MPDDQNPDGDLALGQAPLSGPFDRPDFSLGEIKSSGAFRKALLQAALSPNRDLVQLLLTEALEGGIAAEAIADRYIPDVAEELGNMWTRDEVTFVQVTIGAARLQAMLRDLGPLWAGDLAAAADRTDLRLWVEDLETSTRASTATIFNGKGS